MTNVLSWNIVPEQPTPALVIVSNVSPQATEKMVKDFFLFCGKIKAFEMQTAGDGDSQVALVLFERESAAKTACVLSNALIMDSQITVKPYFEESGSPMPTSPAAPVHPDAAAHVEEEDQPLRQEEKAKANIVAELLAAGYIISDQIMERAKELDHKYHVSGRVQAALYQAKAQALALDEKYKIHENLQTTAKNIDDRFHVKERAQKVEATAKTLAGQALATPTGKKFADVVIHAQSKAQQIQGEARVISEEKKRERAPAAGSGKTSPSAAAVQ